MDEIDAALDFRNVSVIADYIKDRTKDSQFIIISLRNQMFENANELIGIYKTFDITKVVIFNPNAYDVRGNPIVVKKKKEDKNENKSKSNKKLEKSDNISKSNSKRIVGITVFLFIITLLMIQSLRLRDCQEIPTGRPSGYR